MTHEKTTSPSSDSKPKLFKCLLATVGLGILQSFTFRYGADYIDFWVSTLPRILGYIVGLFFFSAIIAGIGFIFQRRQRPPFVSVFVPCFWIIWFLSLAATIFNLFGNEAISR